MVQCESFKNLSVKEKRYAYHLRNACSLQKRESIISELELARQLASISDNHALAELIDYLQTGNEISLRWYNDARREAHYSAVGFDFLVPESIDTTLMTISLKGVIVIRDAMFIEKLRSVGVDTAGLIDFYGIQVEVLGDHEGPGLRPQARELLYVSEPESRLFHRDSKKLDPFSILPNYVNTDFGLCYITNLEYEDTYKILLDEFILDEQIRKNAMRSVHETRLARTLISELNSDNIADLLELDNQDLRIGILKTLSSLLFTHNHHLRDSVPRISQREPEDLYSLFLAEALANTYTSAGNPFNPQAMHLVACRMIDDNGAEFVEINNKKYLIVKDWDQIMISIRSLFKEITFRSEFLTGEDELYYELDVILFPGIDPLFIDSLFNNSKSEDYVPVEYNLEKEMLSSQEKFAPLQDEITARIEALSLPEKRKFLWPRLNVLTNRMGGVMDVLITQTREMDSKSSRSHADELLKRKFIPKYGRSGR